MKIKKSYKLNALGALGILALAGGQYCHSQYNLSHFGDFFSGGAVMWGVFAIGTWARKRDDLDRVKNTKSKI